MSDPPADPFALPPLDRARFAADPLAQFDEWFALASARGLVQPEAAALATATPDGRPSVRMVLLRGFDERGFRFFTHYDGRKGRELAANPRATGSAPTKSVASKSRLTIRGTPFDERRTRKNEQEGRQERVPNRRGQPDRRGQQ